MKYKCPNKDCCTCHTAGHEWEGQQSSKYYVKCPMCKVDFRADNIMGELQFEQLRTIQNNESTV